MQLITFSELKNKYPKSKVLSGNTGFQRNYDFYPYGNYEKEEETFFPVSVRDKRFFAKEIMYVIPYKDQSLVFPEKNLNGKKELKIDGATLKLERDGGEIFASIDGRKYIGYFEMWFSWATNHQKKGVVLGV